MVDTVCQSVTIKVQAIGGRPSALSVPVNIKVRLEPIWPALPSCAGISLYGWGLCVILDRESFRLAQVEDLKKIISTELRFPLERLKLVKGGKPLDDGLEAVDLSDGGMDA